jgi:hypothetical protein
MQTHVDDSMPCDQKCWSCQFHMSSVDIDRRLQCSLLFLYGRFGKVGGKLDLKSLCMLVFVIHFRGACGSCLCRRRLHGIVVLEWKEVDFEVRNLDFEVRVGIFEDRSRI